MTLSRLHKGGYLDNGENGWSLTLKGKSYRDKRILLSYISSPFDNNQQSNIQNISDTFGPDSKMSKLYTAGYTLDAEDTWINPKGKEASVGELQKITQPEQLTKDENLVNQGKMTVEQTKKDMVSKPKVALTTQESIDKAKLEQVKSQTIQQPIIESTSQLLEDYQTPQNTQPTIDAQAKEIANKTGGKIEDVKRNINKFGYEATNNVYSNLSDATLYNPETQTGVKSVDAVATAQLNKSTPQVGKTVEPVIIEIEENPKIVEATDEIIEKGKITFAQSGDSDLASGAITNLFNNKDDVHLVILNLEGYPVAGIQGQPGSDGQYGLINLYVHSGLRNQGVADSLLKDFENKVKELGYNEILLKTPVPDFYEKQNYIADPDNPARYSKLLNKPKVTFKNTPANNNIEIVKLLADKLARRQNKIG
jgi:GNAT superfamily N-acetyltransferase